MKNFILDLFIGSNGVELAIITICLFAPLVMAVVVFGLKVIDTFKGVFLEREDF